MVIGIITIALMLTVFLILVIILTVILRRKLDVRNNVTRENTQPNGSMWYVYLNMKSGQGEEKSNTV